MSAPTSIAEQVEQLQGSLGGRLPAEVLDIFARSQAQLAAAGIPEGTKAVGTRLKEEPLIDAHGAPTSLGALTAGRAAVLIFYRGGWCPYCNIALRTYREGLLPELARRGVALVAVSPQRPDGSLSVQEKNDLAFPVVSDVGNALAAQLGVLMAPRSREVRRAQEQLGIVLEQINADETENLPLPTVVILDPEHTIRWLDVHPDYSTRTEVWEILAALDAKLASAATRSKDDDQHAG
jgi:peroxiredoxin